MSGGEPPNEFLCPITQEIMEHPVSAEDGHVYERAAIEQWLSVKQTSPSTNMEMGSKLTPAYSIGSLIAAWRATHTVAPASLPSSMKRTAKASREDRSEPKQGGPERGVETDEKTQAGGSEMKSNIHDLKQQHPQEHDNSNVPKLTKRAAKASREDPNGPEQGGPERGVTCDEKTEMKSNAHHREEKPNRPQDNSSLHYAAPPTAPSQQTSLEERHASERSALMAAQMQERTMFERSLQKNHDEEASKDSDSDDSEAEAEAYRQEMMDLSLKSEEHTKLKTADQEERRKQHESEEDQQRRREEQKRRKEDQRKAEEDQKRKEAADQEARVKAKEEAKKAEEAQKKAKEARKAQKKYERRAKLAEMRLTVEAEKVGMSVEDFRGIKVGAEIHVTKEFTSNGKIPATLSVGMIGTIFRIDDGWLSVKFHGRNGKRLWIKPTNFKHISTQQAFKPGLRVRVTRGNFEAQMGIIQKYIEKTGKWGIKLDSGKRAGVKDVDLVIVRVFHQGDYVYCDTPKPIFVEKHGRTGIITGKIFDDGRVQWKSDKSGANIRSPLKILRRDYEAENRVEEERRRCAVCKGHPDGTCATCRGSGKMKCWTCQGIGYWKSLKQGDLVEIIGLQNAAEYNGRSGRIAGPSWTEGDKAGRFPVVLETFLGLKQPSEQEAISVQPMHIKLREGGRQCVGCTKCGGNESTPGSTGPVYQLSDLEKGTGTVKCRPCGGRGSCSTHFSPRSNLSV